MKVLIVEDESTFLNILRKKVKSLGFEVSYATDGIEALDKFSRDTPDIILLDLLLPEKSGYEVLKEIREIHKDSVPVIVLTNVDNEEERKQLEALGVHHFIVKSEASLEEVLSKVKEVVSK